MPHIDDRVIEACVQCRPLKSDEDWALKRLHSEMQARIEADQQAYLISRLGNLSHEDYTLIREDVIDMVDHGAHWDDIMDFINDQGNFNDY